MQQKTALGHSRAQGTKSRVQASALGRYDDIWLFGYAVSAALAECLSDHSHILLTGRTGSSDGYDELKMCATMSLPMVDSSCEPENESELQDEPTTTTVA